ncbi:MAG: hypothetical protein M3033_07610 [Acidobacteriota bacterium]|nr:hypothetical protein [Acidobacteriota bacterium]
MLQLYSELVEDNEKVIDYLEQQIPELAAAATKIAYRQALASGSSVLISENGEIVEVFPDGTRKFVQKIEPRIKIKKGTIIKIK